MVLNIHKFQIHSCSVCRAYDVYACIWAITTTRSDFLSIRRVAAGDGDRVSGLIERLRLALLYSFLFFEFYS